MRQELEGRPWRALSHTRQACRMRAAVALFVPRALAGIMGVDREGGYAISFLTRVGGDRMRLLDSDLAIIPCSARAGNMSSLFTSELRLATLFPAGSENQDGNCRNGSGLHTRRVSRTVRRGRIELEAGHIRAGSVVGGRGRSVVSGRRVTYAPGPSHKPSKIARFPRRPAPAPRVGKK